MNHNLLVFPNKIPSLKNYDAYKQYVSTIPNLTVEEEKELLLKFQKENCLICAQKLILSQLKTVIKTAKNFSGYGLPEEDLVQEGNIGLMKAIKNYNLSYNVRLYSYALIWIKSEMQQYILDNWKIIKIGTTNNYKKLFFNYKSLQKKLIDSFSTKKSINNQISKELNIDIKQVEEIEQYMSDNEVILEDAEQQQLLIENKDPYSIIQKNNQIQFQKEILKKSLSLLNDKEKFIIEHKFLTEDKYTNIDLSKILKISSERVRQIEVEAMKKMKIYLNDKI